jgi:hypothetical protein
MRYLLEAELRIKEINGDFQTNRYELTYLVENISTGKYSNIQLDPNSLDIKQNQFRQLNVLEIEIDNIFMELDRSLIKSEDFLRRTMYRYDWIRCKINEYGKIISIDNIKEMMESWSEIKNLLLRDYIGSSVTKYIENIDNQMLHQNYKIAPMGQYFYFGLIFPLIPLKHDSAWQGYRTVELSDFDNYQFEELLTPISADLQIRRYNVSGKTISPNIIKLKKYQGIIDMPINNTYPINANIEVDYVREDVDISWSFKLTNY